MTGGPERSPRHLADGPTPISGGLIHPHRSHATLASCPDRHACHRRIELPERIPGQQQHVSGDGDARMDRHHDRLAAQRQHRKSRSPARPATGTAACRSKRSDTGIDAARRASQRQQQDNQTARPDDRHARCRPPAAAATRHRSRAGATAPALSRRQPPASEPRRRRKPRRSGDHAKAAQPRDIVGGVAGLAQHRFVVLADRRRAPRRHLVLAVDMERRHDRQALAVAERHQRAGMAHLRVVQRLVHRRDDAEGDADAVQDRAPFGQIAPGENLIQDQHQFARRAACARPAWRSADRRSGPRARSRPGTTRNCRCSLNSAMMNQRPSRDR